MSRDTEVGRNSLSPGRWECFRPGGEADEEVDKAGVCNEGRPLRELRGDEKPKED
jgi:hypothetical protein